MVFILKAFIFNCIQITRLDQSGVTVNEKMINSWKLDESPVPHISYNKIIMFLGGNFR